METEETTISLPMKGTSLFSLVSVRTPSSPILQDFGFRSDGTEHQKTMTR